MTDTTDPFVVVDNRLKERFELEAEGHVAYAQYRLRNGQITFIHTIVPPELEGRGVGSALARFALDVSAERGLKVVPKCPFIRGYIERHPEYQKLV